MDVRKESLQHLNEEQEEGKMMKKPESRPSLPTEAAGPATEGPLPSLRPPPHLPQGWVNRRDIWFLILVAMVISFQNCSGARFSSSPADSNNQTFNPANLDPFTCTGFTVLSPDSSGILDVPARAAGGSGTCYAIKVLNAISFSPSSNNPNHDSEVISRNHDVTSTDPMQTHHPYVLGETTLQIYMEGARGIELSGASNALSSITVDNFILVGVGPTALIADPSYYSAYGTADSTIQLDGRTDSIEFRNQAVVLTPFATGGVSTVSPLQLETEIEVQHDYTLDLRALDCGSVGALSDVYLVFQ